MGMVLWEWLCGNGSVGMVLCEWFCVNGSM